MAPLYGRLTGNQWNKTVTRRGHYSVAFYSEGFYGEDDGQGGTYV